MNATDYMKHWEKNQVWTHLGWPRHQQRFRNCAAALLGSTFIDIGCAYGHSTAQMKRIHPSGSWAGADFDRAAIDRARSLFSEIEFFFLSDSDFRGSIGRGFDSVICSEVIEHVEDPISFLSSLSALADRRIIITTPNHPVDDPGHLRVYSLESLRSDIERAIQNPKMRITAAGDFFYAIIDK